MLRVVHISGQEVMPKKLTAKERKAQELELFREDLNRNHRKAALKRIDQIRELIK